MGFMTSPEFEKYRQKAEEAGVLKTWEAMTGYLKRDPKAAFDAIMYNLRYREEHRND